MGNEIKEIKTQRKQARDNVMLTIQQLRPKLQYTTQDTSEIALITSLKDTIDAEYLLFFNASQQLQNVYQQEEPDPDKLAAVGAEMTRVLAEKNSIDEQYLTWGSKKHDEDVDTVYDASKIEHPVSENIGEQDSDEGLVNEVVDKLAKAMYKQFKWSDKDRIYDTLTDGGKDVNKESVKQKLAIFHSQSEEKEIRDVKQKKRVSFPLSPIRGEWDTFMSSTQQNVNKKKKTTKKRKKKKKKSKDSSASSSSSSSTDTSEDSDSSSSSSSSSDEPMLSLSDSIHGLSRSFKNSIMVGDKSKKKKKKKKKSADKYIQKVQLPVFDGSQDFDSWWSMFTALIDDSNEPSKIKFLKMKTSVVGEPYDLIKNLSHTRKSYDRAKKRLYDMYGGLLRQVGKRYSEAQDFKKIQENDFKAFRKLLCLVDQTISCLEQAGRKMELGPSALCHCLVGKAPVSTVMKYNEWRSERYKEDTLYSFSEFLETYISIGITAYETVHGVRGSGTKKKTLTTAKRQEDTSGGERQGFGSRAKSPGNASTALNKLFQKKCRYCKGAHPLWTCDKFKAMSVDERWKVVTTLHVCFKCLSPKHFLDECESTRPCGVGTCKGRHHRLLHNDKAVSLQQASDNKQKDNINDGQSKTYATSSGNVRNVESENAETEKEDSAIDETKKTYLTTTSYRNRVIALRTVPIILGNGRGETIKVNALLDDASDTSYVNQDVANYLNLKGEKSEGFIDVFGGNTIKTETELVEVVVSSLDGGYHKVEVMEVVNSVVGDMKVVDWTQAKDRWSHLRDIPFPQLAEPRKVDVLLGLNFLDAMDAKITIRGGNNEPSARLTALGWCCAGIIDGDTGTRSRAHVHFTNRTDNTEKMIEKFWEWEALPCEQNVMSPEEKLADKIVSENLKKKGNQYETVIPWKDNVQPIVEDNYEQAVKRLEQNERKLLKQPPEVAQGYQNVFISYIAKKYMEFVTNQEIKLPEGKIRYLPHFAIIKFGRQSSKIRPVFDSAAEFMGFTINEWELTGPKLLQNILLVMIRFRLYLYVIGCDISEMYLQILLAMEERDYQRLVWREKLGEGEIKVLRSTRVMFGRKSSPFIALKVSRHNAEVHKEEFPMAAETVMKSTYMDDSMDSKKKLDEIIRLYHELQGLWKHANMVPRKWFTNAPELLEMIPESERATKFDTSKLLEPVGQTLGSYWNALKDIYTIVVKLMDEMMNTKRQTLKVVASLFDPVGFIAPYTVRARTYIQEMWSRGCTWDQDLPEDILGRCLRWQKEMEDLKNLEIPRCLIPFEEPTSVMLHTFCDASQLIYGAVSYIRAHDIKEEISMNLALSKAKVAPVRQVSIPRLELQGAVEATKVAGTMNMALDLPDNEIFYWTDSIDVLYWVLSQSRCFKPWVANRIAYIQERSKPSQWGYVPTKENVADLLSRGMKAEDIVNSQEWREGPAFLKLSKNEWPQIPVEDLKTPGRAVIVEQKDIKHCMTFITKSTDLRFDQDFVEKLASKFSTWRKLVNVLYNVVLFTLRTSKSFIPDVCDLKRIITDHVIISVQTTAWKKDIERIKAGEPPVITSVLAPARPFFDEDGVLRSQTRLQKADVLEWDEKNPILLPNSSAITMLCILRIHEENLHASVNQTWAVVRAKYWIQAGRETCKKVIATCMICNLNAATPATQVMADLPVSRVTPTYRPFTICSVDFAGPFLIKRGRGLAREKRWMCLFDCFSVRVVHLEICTSLDTDSLMLALERFVNRRGRPKEINSDNGTNFVKGSSVLQEEIKKINWKEIEENLSNWEITWKFQPAYAPHFGGVHESLVKIAKRTLYRVAGNAALTEEELRTLFTKIESCMNQRPLGYVSSDCNEENVLTPGMFLTGTMATDLLPMKTLTKDEEKDTPKQHKERWRLVAEITRHFWSRWIREWLPSISTRAKWWREKVDVGVDDIVLMVEPGVRVGRWPLARVTKIVQGKDGHIRSVTVTRGYKEYTRPITKICPVRLLLNNNEGFSLGVRVFYTHINDRFFNI